MKFYLCYPPLVYYPLGRLITKLRPHCTTSQRLGDEEIGAEFWERRPDTGSAPRPAPGAGAGSVPSKPTANPRPDLQQQQRERDGDDKPATVGIRKSDFGRGWLDKKKKPLTTVSPGAPAADSVGQSAYSGGNGGDRPASPRQTSGQPVSGQRSFGTGWLNRKQMPSAQAVEAAAITAPSVGVAAKAAAAPSAKTTGTGMSYAATSIDPAAGPPAKLDPPQAVTSPPVSFAGNLTTSERPNTASSSAPPRPFGSWSKKPSDGRAANAAAAPAVGNGLDDGGGSDRGAADGSSAGASLRSSRGTAASCLPAGPPAATACCESCGRGGEGLLRCSRCKTAFFCGPVCQRQGWQRHKGQCKIPI